MFDQVFKRRADAALVDRGAHARGERRARADVPRHIDIVARLRDAAHDGTPFGVAHDAHPGQAFEKAGRREHLARRACRQRRQRAIDAGGEPPFVDEDRSHVE